MRTDFCHQLTAVSLPAPTRIIRFVDNAGQVRYGVLVDEKSALVLGGSPLESVQPTGEAATVARLLAPVQPPNIYGIGRNYRDHAAEGGREVPDKPLIFQKPTTSVIGPEEAIALPRSAPDEVDFEAELAVVIGRTAKDVPAEEALGYVFGYTCANDVSARDCQRRHDKQWTRAKGFDTFCPLGPWMVPAGEVDPAALRVRSYLNGRLMQDGSTADMVFSVAELVSYLSCQFTLLPGTVILTGTPAGVGAFRDPPVFLRAGDEVSVEVSGIGRLTNRVQNSAIC